jgi:hypothetical protein
VLAQDSSLEQLRQRVIAAHHLEAMGAGEIEAYVLHRLQCVGWAGNPEFDPEVFAALHAATGGIPRRVNQLMSRLMLLGAVEQKSRIDLAMLSLVRSEMEGDSAPAEVVPHIVREPAPLPEAHSASSAAPQVDLAELLENREEQIAELQHTVAELAQATEGNAQASEDWTNRLELLELRVAEQDRAVRHVLTMLIEWFEGESPREAA